MSDPSKPPKLVGLERAINFDTAMQRFLNAFAQTHDFLHLEIPVGAAVAGVISMVIYVKDPGPNEHIDPCVYVSTQCDDEVFDISLFSAAGALEVMIDRYVKAKATNATPD